MIDDRYSYLWEYTVAPDQEAEFLAHYAPDGTWADLFRRAPGYLGTELYRDREQPDRFLTLDHWRDEAAFRAFRSHFAAEFEALDRRCSRLTIRESSLGELRPASRRSGAADR